MDLFTEAEVKDAVEDLPEQFRMAVLLADVEGFSYKEIAEILDIPIGTVMSRLHRGRKELEKRLYDFAVSRGLAEPAPGPAHLTEMADRPVHPQASATRRCTRSTTCSTASSTDAERAQILPTSTSAAPVRRALRLLRRAPQSCSSAARSRPRRSSWPGSQAALPCTSRRELATGDRSRSPPPSTWRQAGCAERLPASTMTARACSPRAVVALLDRACCVLDPVLRASSVVDPHRSSGYLQARRQSPRYPAATTRHVSRRPGRLGASPSGSRSGSRAASPSPSPTSRTRSSRLRRGSPPRPRSSWPQATGLRGLAGPGPAPVTDRAGWIRANIASFQRLLRPLTDKLGDRMGGSPPARSRAGSPAPRSACCSAGCRPGCSASTTCWSSRTTEARRRPGPRLLRRSQRARAREALRVPAQGVPAVARAARGHPPGPVHRRAVAARALPRAGRADARLGRPRPEALPRRARARSSTTCARAASRSTTAGSSPCSPRPSSGSCSTDRRAHEPARGPRRRHHGPRRRRP